MAILAELSDSVRARREELGLSQQQLARLAGLSRATISGLESGALTSLSLSRAERLANEIGLSLAVTGRRTQRGNGAIARAARAASVSYGIEIPADELERSLHMGVIAPSYVPQLKALLDEAPLSLLSDVAAELEKKCGARRNVTWSKMRQLARALGCTRGIWLEHS